jgi:hypothetical protein
MWYPPVKPVSHSHSPFGTACYAPTPQSSQIGIAALAKSQQLNRTAGKRSASFSDTPSVSPDPALPFLAPLAQYAPAFIDDHNRLALAHNSVSVLVSNMC